LKVLYSYCVHHQEILREVPRRRVCENQFGSYRISTSGTENSTTLCGEDYRKVSALNNSAVFGRPVTDGVLLLYCVISSGCNSA
jgi:hypothetical protein